MTNCQGCGRQLSEQSRFCDNCGAKVPDESPAAEAARLQNQIAHLRAELASVEDAVEFQSYGFYEPRFGLETSEEYANRLKLVRQEQKSLIKRDESIATPKEWVVDGSLAKGKKMLKEQCQLMLRAFNGDCDAVIARTKYDNVSKLETRIRKSFDSINKLGSTKSISISAEFLELKLAELHLVHEHREMVYREREEERIVREQMREDERAEKEIQKALKDAEKDEERSQKALDKARAERVQATGSQLEKLEGLITKLENELQEAINRKAKSIARAQLTRSGHVYVLSNVGAFGEGVYKIGMTRRLEPLERVHELGGASVPFRFDVHVMIYTEDAPALEAKLHQEFESRRINLVNRRREYFRVSLSDIQEAVRKHHGEVTFVTSHAAEEHRRSSAMRVPPEQLS